MAQDAANQPVEQDPGWWNRNMPGWLGGEAGKFFGGGYEPVQPTFFQTAEELVGGQTAAQNEAMKLRYGATYDPVTKGFTVANDPYMMGQLGNLETFYRTLDEAGARKAIEGKYQNAAEIARRRAAIFGEQGAQTAEGVGSAYTGAGEEIAGLAQGGGTAVTGLTGPSQDFQSLYGMLPGMGSTAAQDITGQFGFEAENLEDIARAALRSGTQQGRRLADFIANMSANQYAAASSQLLARNEQRRTLAVEEYLFNKQQDEAAFDYANTAIAGMLDIDKSKKEVMRHLGVSKEEEVPAAMEAHRQKYGAAALGRLAEFIAITTGVGQGG